MTSTRLADTAKALVGAGKGLLAMDESTSTIDERFAAAGIPQTLEMHIAWRNVILGTPGLGDSISGAILFDETIRQSAPSGEPFPAALEQAGIIPGIKVDLGAKPLAGHPGETVTEGLDGLRERLKDYAALGARFAKWRAVITIGDGLPSAACLNANAHALARYAALCQEAGVVPMVEPEVLMTGDHGLDRCEAVTGRVLLALFEQLNRQGVALEGVILKPNMVTPGSDSHEADSVAAVALATIRCFSRTVPAAVAGIAFLSGGQSGALASARLNAMNRLIKAGEIHAPWPVVFSFSRAIEHPGLELWAGQEANARAAQAALAHRARCAKAAIAGDYDAAMEKDAA
jgi:fructose-bisphosphate aldolase class I